MRKKENRLSIYFKNINITNQDWIYLSDIIAKCNGKLKHGNFSFTFGESYYAEFPFNHLNEIKDLINHLEKEINNLLLTVEIIFISLNEFVLSKKEFSNFINFSELYMIKNKFNLYSLCSQTIINLYKTYYFIMYKNGILLSYLNLLIFYKNKK